MKYIISIILLLSILCFSFADDFFVEYSKFYAGFYEYMHAWELLVNLQIPSELITYKESEGKLQGELRINVIVRNLETGRSVNNEWETKSIISKQEQLSSNLFLLDNSDFLLSVGIYEITTLVIDLNSLNKYTIIDTLVLEPINEKAFMSDIMTGIRFYKDTLPYHKFQRNGYTIIPFPSKQFTSLNPFLIVYAEYYNIPENLNYSIDYIVLSKEDTILKLQGKRGVSEEYDFIDIGGINTLGLKDGEYTLKLIFKADSIVLEKQRTFSKSSAINKSIVSKYKLTDKQLKYYDKIEYIASFDDIKKLKQLNKQGKHLFLIRFWEKRDPTPSNNKLEALDEYIERIEYVNKHYSSGFESGYESDRGYIYLKYGPPDEEMIVPSSKNYKSFENWIYYSNGGMQFIFTDIKGFGKFELVYTNVEEEDIPVNWYKYVDSSIIRFSRD